jgi:pyruvate dehydrogenase E2 component (dihydrolipoamide acetyltransferase)
MAVEIFMPKMSDFMEFGEIISWKVKEGDKVVKGQVIMEVMTDKSVADLEAPASGIIKGIREGTEDGAKIKVGDTIAFIVDREETVPHLPPIVVEKFIEPEPVSGISVNSTQESQTTRIRATPAARRVAQELNIDLKSVKGTGPGGTIRDKDVIDFSESHSEYPPE